MKKCSILTGLFVLLPFYILLSSCANSSENRYVNPGVGFQIDGPEGWHRKTGEGQLVRYTPGPFGDFPVLSVVLEEYPGQEVSLPDLSRSILADFQRNYKTELVEPPTAVQLDGIEGMRFVLDVENIQRGTQKVAWIRNLFYQFMKGEKVISILAMSGREDFEEYRGAFEESVGSFRWSEN